MPSMPCSAYHQYPFPSLLLIDLPALWQPSLPASCVVMSHATPHQYPRSLPPEAGPSGASPTKRPITWDLKDPAHPLHHWEMQQAYKQHIKEAGYDCPVPCSPSAKSGSQLPSPVSPQQTSPQQTTSPLSDSTGFPSPGLESIPKEETEAEAAPPGGHHQPPNMLGGIHEDP